MQNTIKNDFQIVIDGNARVLTSLDRMIVLSSEDIDQMKHRRKAYLLSEVGRLLPYISKKILKRIESSMPHFLTPVEYKLFLDNCPFLGIFNRKGTDNALAILQARLSFYLSQYQWGELNVIDKELEINEGMRSKLEEQQSRLLELHELMVNSLAKKVPLPLSVAEEIVRMANESRKESAFSQDTKKYKAPISSTFLTVAPHYSSSDHNNNQNDTDLWLYMMLDVPTSFRTLLLSSLHNNHTPRFDAINIDDTPINALQVNLSENTQVTEGQNIEMLNSQNIATDDRLGNFS
jgi:hypothetical protein